MEERNEDSSEDAIDIADKLLARLDAMRVEDENKAPIQAKVNEESKKPRTKNRQQERRVGPSLIFESMISTE